jgi:hypothetical protein
MHESHLLYKKVRFFILLSQNLLNFLLSSLFLKSKIESGHVQRTYFLLYLP